jgi:hypothetical protein
MVMTDSSRTAILSPKAGFFHEYGQQMKMTPMLTRNFDAAFSPSMSI